MNAKQLQLFGRPGTEYGGDTRRGKRKVRRPIAVKSPMHVVFRSRRARGSWSLLNERHRFAVNTLVYRLADRFEVRIHGYENVGNHVHLVVQVRSRRSLQAFLRVFGQSLMFLVTGARKGKPKGRFFDAIAYSRVVKWGRDFENVMLYVSKNTLEALGVSRVRQGRWLTCDPSG